MAIENHQARWRSWVSGKRGWQWKLPGRNAGYISEIIDSINRVSSGKPCLATPEGKLKGPFSFPEDHVAMDLAAWFISGDHDLFCCFTLPSIMYNQLHQAHL